jgi:hypothetical protein
MATYQPPTAPLPLFDAGVFIKNDTVLTIEKADARYLKFPQGQGTETIPSLIVTGQGTINNIAIKQATGTNNQVVGYNSLTKSTTASYDNMVFGSSIATGVLSGNNNTFMGNNGFGAVTSASNNTSLGSNNGSGLTSGNYNTFLGKDAMVNLTTGSNNTAVGSTNTGDVTGGTLTTGSNNTFLGGGARTSLATVNNSTAIGFNAVTTASNQIVLGTSSESVKIPGSITLKNTQAIAGMACGSAGAGSASGSVSFGYTFSSAPFVVASINNGSTDQLFSVNVSGISTTGFNYYKTQRTLTGNGGAAVNEAFCWIAIGT